MGGNQGCQSRHLSARLGYFGDFYHDMYQFPVPLQSMVKANFGVLSFLVTYLNLLVFSPIKTNSEEENWITFRDFSLLKLLKMFGNGQPDEIYN